MLHCSIWNLNTGSEAIAFVASLTAASAVCAAVQEKSAASMRDVQAHFAACFHPPQDAEGSRITFYFSLTRDNRSTVNRG